jgi:Flp pilus assembly protein TadG
MTRILKTFVRNRDGVAAIEFAVVASPCFLLILGLLQLGVYFMAQAALDGGVATTAQTLRNSFTTTSPDLMTPAQLKEAVVSNAGALIEDTSNTAVEIRPLTSLDAAATPIVDGIAAYGLTTSVLVLRAQSQVVVFAPGFSSLGIVESAAMVRREGT